MSSLDQNDWNVLYSSIAWVEGVLHSHSEVDSFSRTRDIFFEIRRKRGDCLKMLLVNEYTIGIAAVHRALSEFPGVEYIVTCGNWNGYTQEAKEYGNKNKLGIFVIGEFLGALYKSNPRIFVQKHPNGEPKLYYRSA